MTRFTIIAALVFLVGCTPTHTINGKNPSLEGRVYLLEAKMENNAKLATYNAQMDNMLRRQMQHQIDSLSLEIAFLSVDQDAEGIARIQLKKKVDSIREDLSGIHSVIRAQLSGEVHHLLGSYEVRDRLDSLLDDLRQRQRSITLGWGEGGPGASIPLPNPTLIDRGFDRGIRGYLKYDSLCGWKWGNDTISYFVPGEIYKPDPGGKTDLEPILIDSSNHPSWRIVKPENFHAVPEKPELMGRKPKKKAPAKTK